MPSQDSALEIARRVRTGESSAAEQIEAAREACERRNPELGAFVALDWKGAARQAAEIDSAIANGENPGPLGGVPFGVKDLQNLAGFVTGRGSRLHANDDPVDFDSPSVARLRRAGAIPIGKTATAEFGMNSATTTPAYGTARNPWNRELTPGGSSGGSAAAVSAGIVSFGTGSDEGGSIRSPASFCGLVGLKPTHGLVPRDDGLSDTNTVGALTRTVADSAALLDVMAGSHPQDKMTYRGQPLPSYERAMTAIRVDSLRACWSPDLGYAVAEPDIIARARESAFGLADAAQFDLHEVRLEFEPPPDIWMRLVAVSFLQTLTADGYVPARESELGPAAASFVEYARGVTPRELAQAEAARGRLERQVADFFQRFSFLLTPTVACDPFTAEGPVPERIAGQPASLVGPEPYTMLANLSWIPAISIPAGLSTAGYPVGLQVHAPWDHDGHLLALARVWEETQPWPTCAPGYADP